MNYFAQAVAELNDEEKYKNLPIRTTDDLAIDSQLMSLEEAMAAQIDTYSSVLDKLSSIENARHEIIEDANQLQYASAEEKLSKALVLCDELFSMEDVGQHTHVANVNHIDVSNRQLIKTYSAEAINFIDTAIKIGKLIIKKFVDFILYIYRLIASIARRVWAKIRGTGKKDVSFTIKEPTGLGMDGKPVTIALPDQSKITNSDTEDQLREYLADKESIGNPNTAIKFNIPTEFATTLWDYSNRKLTTSGQGLLSIIAGARGDLCKVLHTTYMGLADCTEKDYYSIINYIYRGSDTSIKGSVVREITAQKGIARMKVVETTINKAYSDCLNIPSEIEGKVIYPGVVFSTPNYKKSNSMTGMIRLVETDKAKAVKEAATSQFTISSADELTKVIVSSFDLINTMVDISDKCESRINDVQKRLEEIVEVSNSEAGRANFMKFYGNDIKIRASNPSNFVNTYNTAILQNLRLIAKQQLDVINAVGNLASGIGDGRSKGILQIAMDHYTAMGVVFEITG